MKLSVIMPAYNEAPTVREAAERVLALDTDLELLIIDDGSTDGTTEIVRRVAAEHRGRVRLLRFKQNQGKGTAVRLGIDRARGDIILIQDADLEYDPADYHDVIAPILAGKADVVYGSRFLGVHRCFMFWHYMGNKLLNLVANVLFNTMLSDMETCYKAFRADFVKRIPLRSRGFAIEPELTAKVLKRGARVYEVPISYTGRSYAEGKKVSWRDGLWAFLALFRYRIAD
jgi:glycosyltransferase involved in cell wall biosynthesis